MDCIKIIFIFVSDMDLKGFISVLDSLPQEEGVYEIYSPKQFHGIGKLRYHLKRGWIMDRFIKGFFEVEYWRPFKK